METTLAHHVTVKTSLYKSRRITFGVAILFGILVAVFIGPLTHLLTTAPDQSLILIFVMMVPVVLTTTAIYGELILEVHLRKKVLTRVLQAAPYGYQNVYFYTPCLFTAKENGRLIKAVIVEEQEDDLSAVASLFVIVPYE